MDTTEERPQPADRSELTTRDKGGCSLHVGAAGSTFGMAGLGLLVGLLFRRRWTPLD